MTRWYLLHPAVVHFPLALLLVGGAARALSGWRRAPVWLEEASDWLLWLGAATAWLAVLFGHVAEDHAPHVPPAWRVLHDHEELATWTAGWYTALGVAVLWLRRRAWPGRWSKPAITAAWLLGWAGLLRTAQLGGELVFTYGLGVGEAVAGDRPMEDVGSVGQ
ncbi:MAG: hypothetical protein HY553_18030 [Elusimicrobia bacterium]|nr:hypothetical protein [Elusimicrobiota bacterium]